MPREPYNNILPRSIPVFVTDIPRGVRPRLEGKEKTPLSSRVATGISWSPLSGLKGVKTPVKFGEKTWPGSQPAAVWAWMSLGLPRAASRGQSFQILTFFQKAGLSQRLLWQRGLAGSVSSSSRSLLEPLVIYCVQFEVLMCPPAERLCQSAQDTARGWSLCLIAVYLGARWALTFLSLSVWRAWW